jgi:hypothetical protein
MPKRYTSLDEARDHARKLCYQCRKPVRLVLLAQPLGLYAFVGPEEEFPKYLGGCVLVETFTP